MQKQRMPNLWSEIETARTYVERGQFIVAAQEAHVRRLQVNGKDFAASQGLLDTFRQTKKVLVSDLARQLRVRFL
jgi:hypothetical protein